MRGLGRPGVLLQVVLGVAVVLAGITTGCPRADASTTVAGSASGTGVLGPPAHGGVVGFDATGQYTSSGPLGTGTYAMSYDVFFSSGGFREAGDVTFASQGSTLHGTMTGVDPPTAPPNEEPIAWTLALTAGTGRFAGMQALLTATGNRVLNAAFTSTTDTFTFSGTLAPALSARIANNGGPMCADNRGAVRVNVVVRPKNGNTVAGVTDTFMTVTAVTQSKDAWFVHLKSGSNTVPAHVATVVLHTTVGDQTFAVNIPAFACT